jgi:competence ComEA-like helix-hairpin-helix protein
VQDLRIREQKATGAKRGLWAHSSGRAEEVTEQVGSAVKAGFGKVVDKAVSKVKSTISGNKGTDTRINPNTATIAELEGLPGIGPKTAEAIIQARPIKSIEAFAMIRGIGPKKLEALRELVRFE